MEVCIAKISDTRVHALKFDHLLQHRTSSSQDGDRSLNIRCSDPEQGSSLAFTGPTFLYCCMCRRIMISPGRFGSDESGQQFVDRSAQFGGRLRYFLKGKDRPDPDCWSFVAKLLSRRAEPFIQGPAALFRERLSSCSRCSASALSSCSPCSLSVLSVSRLVARRPRYCAARVPSV